MGGLGGFRCVHVTDLPPIRISFQSLKEHDLEKVGGRIWGLREWFWDGGREGGWGEVGVMVGGGFVSRRCEGAQVGFFSNW